MKSFVIGDIHGANKALLQCLERSKFDYDNDTLICLGDVVDGWPETPQAIDTLLKIKNLVYIMGNHDAWADKWHRFGWQEIIWTEQGGRATINAYIQNPELMIKQREFFLEKPYYYVDKQNRLFVHGGIFKDVSVENHIVGDLMWDRTLADKALQKTFKGDERFKHVYIGHTSIWSVSRAPITQGNVTLMDTGGGYEGKLSIMDIDTGEFWQSDKVSELYKGERGRN